MTVSLNTFLLTHPVSLLNSLKCICKKLDLPHEGTKEILRERIIDFTKDKENLETSIWEMGFDYAEQNGHDTSHIQRKRDKNEKSYPHEVTVNVTKPQAPPPEKTPTPSGDKTNEQTNTMNVPEPPVLEKNTPPGNYLPGGKTDEQTETMSEPEPPVHEETTPPDGKTDERAEILIEPQKVTTPPEDKTSKHDETLLPVSPYQAKRLHHHGISSIDDTCEILEEGKESESQEDLFYQDEDPLEKSLNILTERALEIQHQRKKDKQEREKIIEETIDEVDFEKIMEFSQHIGEKNTNINENGESKKNDFESILTQTKEQYKKTLSEFVEQKKQNALLKRELNQTKRELTDLKGNTTDSSENTNTVKNLQAKMEYFISQSIDIVATKDLQIETLMQETSTRNNQIGALENVIQRMKDMQTDLVKTVCTKKDQDAHQPNEINEMNKKIQQIINNQASQKEDQKKWNGNLASIMNQTTTKISSMSSDLKSIHSVMNKNHGQRPRHCTMQQSTANNDNEVIYEKTTFPNSPDQKQVIAIVGDSNINKLEANKIHDKKIVKKFTRYTTEMAKQKPLDIENAQLVSDIVLLTGLNDSLKTSHDIDSIVKNQEEVITNYNKQFPNATIHIGSIAPTGQKQEMLNEKLEIMAGKKKKHCVYRKHRIVQQKLEHVKRKHVGWNPLQRHRNKNHCQRNKKKPLQVPELPKSILTTPQQELPRK